MWWELNLLRSFQLVIAFPSLVENDVDNLVLVADILSGLRHDLVDNFTKEFDVSLRVSDNP